MSHPLVIVVGMTVLFDLDPPHRPLRLVSSTGQPTRDHRYRSGATLGGDARVLYREVLQASLEHGVSLNADALRVILATKQGTQPTSARTFTAAGIWQLMFVDVVTWCRNRQLEVPPGCAAALCAVLQHLDETDTLDPASDFVHDLYDAVDECTGGWVDPEPTPAIPGKARRSLRSGRGPKRS